MEDFRIGQELFFLKDGFLTFGYETFRIKAIEEITDYKYKFIVIRNSEILSIAYYSGDKNYFTDNFYSSIEELKKKYIQKVVVKIQELENEISRIRKSNYELLTNIKK